MKSIISNLKKQKLKGVLLNFLLWLMACTGQAQTNWTQVGPLSSPTNTGIGRVNNIRIDPNNANILYACTPASQLFKSQNSGVTWTSISNGIPATGVTDVAIDPSNSNILYAVTGDGDQAIYHPYSAGLYKSTDGGVSWNTTGMSYVQGNFVGLTCIIINPIAPNNILVGGTNGIRRSTDGGATFTTVSSQSTQNLAFKPGDPNIVFAGSKTGGVFLRSANNGVTFTQITAGLPLSSAADKFVIDVSPVNPDYVYAMASNRSSLDMQGFYRSTDAGISFLLMATTPNIGGSSFGSQAWYDFAVAADPVNADIVYACGVDVFKSLNGGINWTNMTNVFTGGTVHPNMHDLTFSPPSTLYLANDGGVYKTINAGVNWTNISSNLDIAQVYSIGLSSSDPNTIISGLASNGTILTNDIINWRLSRGGEGMIGFIDKNNNNNMYSSYQNGGLSRSTNGGSSWVTALSGVTGTGYWVTPYIQDPVNSFTIYCGTDKVFKSANGAVSWYAISPSFGTVRWLDIDKKNTQIIYAMTNNSVRKTIDGGISWTSIATGLGGGQYLHIHIDANNSNIIYLSTASYTGNNLFRSIDGGTNWVNWGTGLPNVPSNNVATVAGTSGEVYCGTDIGVYYRANGASAWTAFNFNLPPVPVRDLEVSYLTGKLHAATFGRGIWKTDLNVSICGFTNGLIYVNASATGTNTGTDWANAFTDLKTAINAINALPCTATKIWVAAGTYKPTTGTDRNSSFTLQNNLEIHGGFVGNEAPNYDINLRNFAINKTILSGNIGGATNLDNCYNVVRNENNFLNSSAKLDGFTISGGYADGGSMTATSNLNCGAGIYNSQSSPNITNCIFTDNYAMGALNTGGGAMFNYNNASPTISQCSFIFNTATNGGGAVHNANGSPTITNCFFLNNSTTGTGGAIHNYSSSNPTISNSRFSGNTASVGGGAVYNSLNAPTLYNCIFSGNIGSSNGGAIFQENASLTLSNCTFSGNQASSGAGLKNTSNTYITVSNIVNSIFWDDAGAEIVIATSNSGIAATNVSYSLVQGGFGGTGNLNINPEFNAGSDYHLSDQSPAIDAGTATGAALQDIEGTNRTTVPDMGAYENPQACFGSNKTYWSDVVGTTYQWQIFNGSSFVNISNGNSYLDVATAKLTVVGPANTATGTRFRCSVTTVPGIVYSSEFKLRFYNRWLGTTDNNWLNPTNWSCGVVPDQYTDVIMPSAKTRYPQSNVYGTIRKLQAENGSIITVNTGSSLVIVGQ